MLLYSASVAEGLGFRSYGIRDRDQLRLASKREILNARARQQNRASFDVLGAWICILRVARWKCKWGEVRAVY